MATAILWFALAAPSASCSDQPKAKPREIITVPHALYDAAQTRAHLADLLVQSVREMPTRIDSKREKEIRKLAKQLGKEKK